MKYNHCYNYTYILFRRLLILGNQKRLLFLWWWFLYIIHLYFAELFRVETLSGLRELRDSIIIRIYCTAPN